MWLLTSVDDVAAAEATSHLLVSPQYHEWTLHDLSIIWRTLLGRGQVQPLLRGFELFQRVKKNKEKEEELEPMEAYCIHLGEKSTVFRANCLFFSCFFFTKFSLFSVVIFSALFFRVFSSELL